MLYPLSLSTMNIHFVHLIQKFLFLLSWSEFKPICGARGKVRGIKSITVCAAETMELVVTRTSPAIVSFRHHMSWMEFSRPDNNVSSGLAAADFILSAARL